METPPQDEDLYFVRHRTRPFKDFKEYFQKIRDSQYREISVIVYLTKGNFIHTLSFYSKRLPNDIFKFSWVTYQKEEGDDDMNHEIYYNVGNSALYNYQTDCFVEDVFLFDKFDDDDSGDWFSERLLTFFKNVPMTRARAFARGIEIVNRVTGWKWRLVRRFCDNLLEKWYAPDKNGVAPYAMWTWRKFQEDLTR